MSPHDASVALPYLRQGCVVKTVCGCWERAQSLTAALWQGKDKLESKKGLAS